MTYSPITPQGLPSPRDQVAQIQTNFAQFAAIFSSMSGGVTLNHIALNDPNKGDHAAIILNVQTDDPDVNQNLAAFYAKEASSNVGTEPQLFYRIPRFLPTNLDPSSPGNPPTQLTYNTVNTTGPVFQSFLPGGYIFYFGSTTDITVPITVSPAPTQILMAIAYPNTMTSIGSPIPFNVSVQVLNNTQFMIHSTLNDSGPVIPYSFTWMAIARV